MELSDARGTHCPPKLWRSSIVIWKFFLCVANSAKAWGCLHGLSLNSAASKAWGFETTAQSSFQHSSWTPTLNYQLLFAWFCNHLGELTNRDTHFSQSVGAQGGFQMQNHVHSPKTPQSVTLKSCSNFIESQHRYCWERPPWIIKSNHQSHKDNMPFSVFCN